MFFLPAHLTVIEFWNDHKLSQRAEVLCSCRFDRRSTTPMYIHTYFGKTCPAAHNDDFAHGPLCGLSLGSAERGPIRRTRSGRSVWAFHQSISPSGQKPPVKPTGKPGPEEVAPALLPLTFNGTHQSPTSVTTATMPWTYSPAHLHLTTVPPNAMQSSRRPAGISHLGSQARLRTAG